MHRRLPRALGLWLSAATIVTLASSAGVAFACSCSSRVSSPCQDAWRADAVFAGKVVQAEEQPFPRTVEEIRNWRPQPRRVRVMVTEAFLKVSAAEVDLFANVGGGSCGRYLEVGEEYLIYAHRDSADGRLFVSMCSRTSTIKQAGEDLRYLRGLARRAATEHGRLFGVVRREDPDGKFVERRPIAGVPVVAQSGSSVYRTRTRSSGAYEMRVPAGTYRISVDLPDTLHVDEPGSVDLPDGRACFSADFLVEWNGRVSGRVYNAQGDPVPLLAVGLMPVEWLKGDPRIGPRYNARTDAEGRFEITGVPPARFYLGAVAHTRGQGNAEQSVYATDAASMPRVFTLGRGSRIDGVDFRLPQRTKLVEVSGTARAPAGAPATEIRIYVWHEGDEMLRLAPAVVAGSDGRFSLTVIAGRRYRLGAEGYENGRYASKEELPAFEATENLKNLTLQLTPIKRSGS